MATTTDFISKGKNANALFSLKAYRGDGMLLLAMNWKSGTPSNDFVGFSIEYKEPNGERFFALKNRLSFLDKDGNVVKQSISTLLAPIQLFRWVHFPRNAELEGDFIYKVKPVFMNSLGELSYGENQEVAVALNRHTYKDQLNVTFTRGFVSSQAFVDRYESTGGISKLLPALSKDGLNYRPSHDLYNEALSWMGFEARNAILQLLDDAIADTTATVKVIAYDLNLPELVSRFKQLGNRLHIIIDDSDHHSENGAAENQAEELLRTTTPHVKRQKMGQLQHNKTIIVDGIVKAAVCGSTNFSWRGFYVQANNAVVVYGANAIQPFLNAFNDYWHNDDVPGFSETSSADWQDLGLTNIEAKVSFSPHNRSNVLLKSIADDIKTNTKSSLFYSLAFLSQTNGAIRDTITEITQGDELFVYGMSDKRVSGILLHKPDGNVYPVYPDELTDNLPEPFKSEPKGGRGNRMHHKFIVIDFNKPTARVYLGSYNFSITADTKNGENLLLIRDAKIAISYMVEALRIFDHYHFRITAKEAKNNKDKMYLKTPPTLPNVMPWWDKFYSDLKKKRDRELFA